MKLAGSAFKDKDVIKAMEHFTPILVNAPAEKEVARQYGVNGYPHTVFATTKGEEVEKVRGYVETAKFLAAVEKGAKKAKAGKGSKAYRALVKADAELTKALAKQKVKAAFAAIKKAEATELDHPLMEKAAKAKAELLQQGEDALAAAQKKLDAGDAAGALADLRKINLDYKGTDVGKRIQDLLVAAKAATKK